MCFQDIVLEVVYPRCGIYRVSFNTWLQSRKRCRGGFSRESGSRLLSGSRPEGLAMGDHWGHDGANTDYMVLHGNRRGVHLPGGQQSRGSACLDFHPEGCPAAYTKLLITDLRGLKEYTQKDRCVHRSGGKKWLNTYRAVREMKRSGETISGPAEQVGTEDWVNTLVCNGPHPDMYQEFANRPRQWPPVALISDLLKLPMLLVLVGHKLSPEFHLQARISWSHLELILIQELPESVRQGYISCKYVFKRFLKAHRGQVETGEDKETKNSVSSYYIKTTFLCYLENTHPSMITSPFTLFYLDLLHELNKYIKGGKLPHYFVAQCNLLEAVEEGELRIASQVIEKILSDPLNALLTSPTAPQEIFGDVRPDYLVSAFNRVSSHPTCDQCWGNLSNLLARVEERRRQRYSEQRESDHECPRVYGRAELTGLVDMLKEIKLDFSVRL